MPNKQQIISETFNLAAGGGPRATNLSDLIQSLLPPADEKLPEALTEAAKQIDALRVVSQAQADATGGNTEAVWQNTAAQSSGGLKSAGSMIGKFFGGGLGAVPIVSLISGLFGGGKPAAPPPLVRFALPPSVQFEGVVGPTGQAPRSRDLRAEATTGSVESTASRVAPAVTIQVQAMDSRSFLDHSEEIARAVREAMLHMHPLNDFVSDL